MKLIQYWDTGDPPDDVAGWVDGFRVMNPEMEHRLYSRDDAAWFIKKRLGQRHLKAFEACAVPSMQSDYFRLCAIISNAGVYADADLQCVQPVASLLSTAPHSLMLVWDRQLLHSFMMYRETEDPFLRACLALATQNIEERWEGSAYTVAGPGVINAVRVHVQPAWLSRILPFLDNEVCRPWRFPELVERAVPFGQSAGVAESVSALTVVHALQAEPWLLAPVPAYKQTAKHWLNWPGSVYAP